MVTTAWCRANHEPTMEVIALVVLAWWQCHGAMVPVSNVSNNQEVFMEVLSR